MKTILLPADVYTVVNQTILTEIDKKILISLYEPIIGPTAVSLFLTLWSDLDKNEIISRDYNHHHLMTILKASNINNILEARTSLEAVGLVKSYIKKNDNVNEYLYELYSPLSAYEFFNHPVLSILLLNNIGENEYKFLLDYYKKKSVSIDGFEEITSSMNETFKVSNTFEATEEIRKQTKLGINLDNIIDFDLLISSIPKGLVTNKTFSKKTKELINQLAYIYKIDTLKMVEIIRMVITDIGTIDKDKLRMTVRKNYEYNNNGSLPTIVYRTQPEHLKAPIGDTSNRGKMIYVFENTKPYDFLKSKNKGVNPSNKDLKILEHLAVDYGLSPGLINILVDYALRINDGKLNQNYLETIAIDWKRKNIKTVTEAMELITKGRKKKTVPNLGKITSKKENVNISAPSWMYEEQHNEPMTLEEQQELDELFEEFEVN